MIGALLGIFILLLLCAGVILLQIFLSKKESKWPGLILPAITLLFSILAVLGMSFYITFTEIEQNGKAIMSAVNNYPAGMILSALYIFVLYNIPTVLLLGIYFACRGKRKKNKEIEKMNIQDLQ